MATDATTVAEASRGALRFWLVEDPDNPLAYRVQVSWLGALMGGSLVNTGPRSHGDTDEHYQVFEAVGSALEDADLRRPFVQAANSPEKDSPVSAVADDLLDDLDGGED